MRLRPSFVAWLTAGLLGCVAPDPELSETSSKLHLHADGIANRYIVMLAGAPHAALAADARAGVDATIDRLAADHGAAITRRYSEALRGFAATMTEADARALADQPEVALVEQVVPMRKVATQTNATWGLDRIDQRNLPLDTTYNFAADGTGVTVFVIDSGIRPTHLEFTGRVRRDLGGTVIDDGNGVVDCDGHGTHVSGSAGGTVFGVAKKATIVPIRVLDCEGAGTSDGVVGGIDFVAGKNIPRSVANMSIGGPGAVAVDTAVQNLVAKGVTAVVAAGNENQNACNFSPAREPLAITVGATGMTDARASFSNFGSCVDLFAPGVDITSAWMEADNQINTISGTSMASPHVAGAAALFLEKNPSATPAQVAAGILASTTPNKVTDPVGSPNKLLFNTFEGGAGGNVAITAPANGAQVTLPFSITVDAAGATKVEIVVDGAVLGADTTAPFAFTVDAMPLGPHTVIAAATDSSGGQARAEITIEVVAGGGFGGGGPAPVVPTRRDGGCSTGGAPGGGPGLAVIALALIAVRRRRRNN